MDNNNKNSSGSCPDLSLGEYKKTVIKAFLVEIKNGNKVAVHMHADPKFGDVFRFPGGIPVESENIHDPSVLISSIKPDLFLPLKQEDLSNCTVHYNSFVWKETREIWAFVIYRGPDDVSIKTDKHKKKMFCDFDTLLSIFPGGVNSVKEFGKLEKEKRFLTVFESELEEEESKGISMRPELGMAHLAEAINKKNFFYFGPVSKENKNL